MKVNTSVTVRKSANPRMISGTTNPSRIVKLAVLATRPRHRSRPIANSVPIGTAITTVKIASRKLWNSAPRSAASLKNASVGSCVHHRSEKPCQALRERPELNENAIAIVTGRIDHAR